MLLLWCADYELEELPNGGGCASSIDGRHRESFAAKSGRSLGARDDKASVRSGCKALRARAPIRIGWAPLILYNRIAGPACM